MLDSPMRTKACLAVFSDKSSLQYYEKREVALSKRSRAGDHCLAVHVSRRHGIAWSVLNSEPRDDAPELLERPADGLLVPDRDGGGVPLRANREDIQVIHTRTRGRPA